MHDDSTLADIFVLLPCGNKQPRREGGGGEEGGHTWEQRARQRTPTPSPPRIAAQFRAFNRRPRHAHTHNKITSRDTTPPAARGKTWSG
jgi:hypothetical protein